MKIGIKQCFVKNNNYSIKKRFISSCFNVNMAEKKLSALSPLEPLTDVPIREGAEEADRGLGSCAVILCNYLCRYI